MAKDVVRLDGNTLVMPGEVRVRFVRTLRLPEQGTHPLPPGLGDFPVRMVSDYADTVPEEWRKRGGVLLPMYLREAMWLSFSAAETAALQVGVGKVCAVSGRPWTDKLSQDPQNYVVLPDQPWLDGINSGEGTIRQFVAVPLGLGATVEGQVTGAEVWGGIQLQNFAAKHPVPARATSYSGYDAGYGGMQGGYGGPPAPAPGSANAMGLGVGGTMRQEIYKDSRALSEWKAKPAGRVFVHLVTPPDWRRITGEEPPASPVSRASYTQAGLPWYDYYDADGTDLQPAQPLQDVVPVGDWLGQDHDPWHPVAHDQTVVLNDPRGRPVQDGDW
ncbi:hypothetical protein [Labedaea rhizosphaerae]|nr:hypothetical protein [Labedaea rhizosphaerae]